MWELEERLEHEQRFNVALINGGGRGRPKSNAFVSHVRYLLATGLNLSRRIVIFLCLARSCLVLSCRSSSVVVF